MRQVWAVIQRDWRKYLRSPRLVAASLLLPFFQLLILGYTIGGHLQDMPIAMVDLDHGPAALRLRQKLLAIAAGPRTFFLQLEGSLSEATAALHDGTVVAALVIPAGYSRGAARPNLIIDNTDLFSVIELHQALELLAPLNIDGIPFVEMFPFTEWMQYLAPACVVMALSVACLLGGIIVFLDDKSFQHSGIRSLEFT